MSRTMAIARTQHIILRSGRQSIVIISMMLSVPPHARGLQAVFHLTACLFTSQVHTRWMLTAHGNEFSSFLLHDR